MVNLETAERLLFIGGCIADLEETNTCGLPWLEGGGICEYSNGDGRRMASGYTSNVWVCDGAWSSGVD